MPAGNETFDRELVRRYLGPWAQAVGSDPEAILSLGTEAATFNLTVLAVRLSSQANGVSKLHGQVASSMWRHLWPRGPEQPIGAITNGVHTESWIGPEMRALYAQHVDPNWEQRLLEPDVWSRVSGIPDGAPPALLCSFVGVRLVRCHGERHSAGRRVALLGSLRRADGPASWR